jgi:hypothetical protein
MATNSPYSTRFKIGAALVVALAALLIGYAITGLDDGGDDPVLQDGDQAVVENLIPGRDAQVPQQSNVGIDLVTGWDAALIVNGVEIPRDQLQRTPEIGLTEFTPAPDTAVEALQTGRNCVNAVIWRLQDGRGVNDRSVPWCFEVV